MIEIQARSRGSMFHPKILLLMVLVGANVEKALTCHEDMRPQECAAALGMDEAAILFTGFTTHGKDNRRQTELFSCTD